MFPLGNELEKQDKIKQGILDMWKGRIISEIPRWVNFFGPGYDFRVIIFILSTVVELVQGLLKDAQKSTSNFFKEKI